MEIPLKGLHHVTATVNKAQEDIDFYVSILGLRLVKQTVNFDNNQVYHFYYGTEVGTPGSIMTTFPYFQQNVRKGLFGTGQVSQTAFSVAASSISFWQERLTSFHIPFTTSIQFGAERLIFSDPSGLSLALVANEQDVRSSWQGIIEGNMGIRGIYSVNISVADLEPTVTFFTNFLGLSIRESQPDMVRLFIDEDLPGKYIDIFQSSMKKGINGIGTVHHVALAIEGEEPQAKLHEALKEQGIRVTEILDRKYFKSIYFREPGGVLIEIATINPGFTIDEEAKQLGQYLMLPPWEEVNRSHILENLPAIKLPT